jgi:hypothetical protein
MFPVGDDSCVRDQCDRCDRGTPQIKIRAMRDWAWIDAVPAGLTPVGLPFGRAKGASMRRHYSCGGNSHSVGLRAGLQTNFHAARRSLGPCALLARDSREPQNGHKALDYGEDLVHRFPEERSISRHESSSICAQRILLKFHFSTPATLPVRGVLRSAKMEFWQRFRDRL